MNDLILNKPNDVKIFFSSSGIFFFGCQPNETHRFGLAAVSWVMFNTFCFQEEEDKKAADEDDSHSVAEVVCTILFISGIL